MRVRWKYILLVVLGLVVCGVPLKRVARIFKTKYDVDQRLGQYGAVVRERLAGDFERVGCSYPPGKVVLVGLKEERVLEVWVKPVGGEACVLLRVYPIRGLSGKLGPKLVEGDMQVPEGIYRIDGLNPNSRFHLSMRVDYPNDYDKARAIEDGRSLKNLGGDIMIHGGRSSAGCLAMGDEVAEDLFVLVAETGLGNVEVILSPIDFRVKELVGDQRTEGLYRAIRQRLLETGASGGGEK